MYNSLIALAISAVAFGLVLLAGFPWTAGLFPALALFPVAMFFLARRTGKQVEAALQPVQTKMMALQEGAHPSEAKKVLAEVRQILNDTKETYAPWQFLLAGQLDAQVGMLHYMQLDFDAAFPLLDKGGWRDWNAKVAAGCIRYRRGELDEAWAAFDKAEAYARKEPLVYMVRSVLEMRKGHRDKALQTLVRGLEAAPGNSVLTRLKKTIANKQRIDVQALGENWYRFFPEEMARQAMVTGRRGKNPYAAQAVAVSGPPQPRARGKLARRR